MQLKAFKVVFRPFLLLSSSVLAYIYTESLLWVSLFLLGVFYTGIDLFGMDKKKSTDKNTMKKLSTQELGVLGNYIVDSDDSYGLFLSINGSPVFVDIREDELLEERKKFAEYLYANTDILEKNLNSFLAKNPDYSTKELTYIGLHSEELDQAEVFWEPDGYSKLKGLELCC